MLANGPRTATNPPNAILNYLYALLEAETILACQQIGLDPGLGIFHTDQRDRASLALDAMEAVAASRGRLRPGAAHTAYALGSGLRRDPPGRLPAHPDSHRTAHRDDHRLAEQIAPIVERIAHILEAADASRTADATPLTRANNLAAWDKRSPDRRRRAARHALALPDSCRDCGSPAADRRHRYCEDCRKRSDGSRRPPRSPERRPGARRAARGTARPGTRRPCSRAPRRQERSASASRQGVDWGATGAPRSSVPRSCPGCATCRSGAGGCERAI